MNILTSNDKNWGPFTVGRWSKTIGFSLCSGDAEYESAQCHVMLHGFGWAIRVRIPNVIQPLRVKHKAISWDSETVNRMGRDWYYQTWPREFGVKISDMGNGYDFMQVHFGAQTHSSETTMDWCCHLPWKQWRHVRKSLYDENGNLWHTEPDTKVAKDFRDSQNKDDSCPKRHFGFEDYDGEMIVATTHIDEMEWKRGTGWFKWLSFFYPPKIRRSLDLRFNKEVGPQKGSWKGGTVGHGIEMLPGELHEQAFRRYCEMDHERKGRKFRLRFIGPCKAPRPFPFHDPAESCCGATPCQSNKIS